MASELAQQNSPNRPLKRQTRAYSNLKAKIAEKVLLSVRGAQSVKRPPRLADSPNRLHVTAALGMGAETTIKNEIHRHKEAVLQEIREI